MTPGQERRQPPHRPHAVHGPRFFSLSSRLATLVGVVPLVGNQRALALTCI